MDDTVSQHTNESGEYTLERLDEHARIIELWLAGHAPQETLDAVFMAGGPASGKSQLRGSLPQPADAVVVDLDEVRAELPEYQEYVKAGRPDAARLTHREASQLTALITSLAVRRRHNLVLDAVGGDDAGKFSTKIRIALSRGYSVTVRYATVPVEVALERERARFARTSRGVPEEELVAKHAEVSRGLRNILQLPVAIEVYDTSASNPRLIAIGQGGGSREGLEERDPERYAEFLEKGDQ